jgi:hemerythrin-like domain-containing protein
MPAAQPRKAAAGGQSFENHPVERADLASPIAFLAREHERQLTICMMVDRLVHNPRHGAERAEMEAVRKYLFEDLPLHMADEEEGLFPLLRRRCPPDDDMDEVFHLLHREHAKDENLKQQLCHDLDQLLEGCALDDPARFLMNAFAFSETHRRHLAWENAVILPRARKHLTEEDCAALARDMAERRRID